MTRTAEPAAGGDGQLVGSLLRGLAILNEFTPNEPVLGVGQLSERLGASKSSISRLASTLESAGYLERAGERGRYRLGSKLARLGDLAGAELDLRRLARPSLTSVVTACGETTHLGVLDGLDAVTVDFVDGTHAVRMHTAVGKRNRAYASALGKCLLADLPADELDRLLEGEEFVARTHRTITSPGALREQLAAVRSLGYSYDDEETELGMRCVGAPIFDASGSVMAAITVSGPSSRINSGTLGSLAALMKFNAAEISMRAGAPADRRFWGDQPARH